MKPEPLIFEEDVLPILTSITENDGSTLRHIQLREKGREAKSPFLYSFLERYNQLPAHRVAMFGLHRFRILFYLLQCGEFSRKLVAQNVVARGSVKTRIAIERQYSPAPTGAAYAATNRGRDVMCKKPQRVRL